MYGSINGLYSHDGTNDDDDELLLLLLMRLPWL